MEYPREKLLSKEKAIPNPKKNNDYLSIKVNNSCHYFNISFMISKKDSIPIEYLPKTFNNLKEPTFMIIQADLKNKEEHFFNNNNEEIEISEKYYDIYTLDELKNNTKGIEWFNELDLKNAFIQSIKNSNFELLIIKNILLLSINIKNIFGDIKTCHLVLRPYLCVSYEENNKGINSNFSIEIVEKNNLIVTSKLRDHTLNNNNNITFFKNQKDILFNDENNNNNNIYNNTLLNKKTSKKNNKKKLVEEESEKNNKSEANLNLMINILTQNLEQKNNNHFPEFLEEGLIKDSKILQDTEEEESLIGDTISNLKLKKYRLIYRATRDGDSANTFHSICDNYKNLIILIKTKKGVRFGGFTSNNFKASSHSKKDTNNAFIFSLDKKKVYSILSDKYAIYCYENNGPCFAKESLYIPNNFLTKYGKTGKAGGPYQFEKDYEINNGEMKFIVEELEIFHVKIEENN